MTYCAKHNAYHQYFCRERYAEHGDTPGAKPLPVVCYACGREVSSAELAALRRVAEAAKNAKVWMGHRLGSKPERCGPYADLAEALAALEEARK